MLLLVIYILIGVAAFALLMYIFVRSGKQETVSSPQYQSQKALEEYGDPAMLNLYLNAKSNEEREEIASFVNEALTKRRQQQKTAAIKPAQDEEDLTRELPLKAREQQAEDTLAIESILAAPAYQFWQEPALNEKRGATAEQDSTTYQDQPTTVFRKQTPECCPVCGEPLEAGCDFCIYCGNKMAILAEPAPLAPPPAPAPIPIMPAKKAPRHRSSRNKEPEVIPEPTVQAMEPQDQFVEPQSIAEPEPPAEPETSVAAAGNAFCIYCGEPMEQGNTFCIYCGAAVEEAALPVPGIAEPAYEEESYTDEESYTKVIYEAPAAGEPLYAAETNTRDVYAEPEYEADEPGDNEELEFSEPAIRRPDYEEQYGEDELEDAEPDFSDLLQNSTAAASPASQPGSSDYDDAYTDDYDDEGNYEDDLDEAPVDPFAQPTGLATGSTPAKQPVSLQEILDNMRALEEKIFAEVAAADQETRDIPPLDPRVKPVKKSK